MLARRFQANLDAAPPFLARPPLVELSRVASTRYAADALTIDELAPLIRAATGVATSAASPTGSDHSAGAKGRG